jgi:hypothetical protein
LPSLSPPEDCLYYYVYWLSANLDRTCKNFRGRIKTARFSIIKIQLNRRD